MTSALSKPTARPIPGGRNPTHTSNPLGTAPFPAGRALDTVIVPASGLYAGIVAGSHVYLQSMFTVGTWEDCAQFACDAGGSLPAFDEMVALRALGVTYAGPHWAADRANGDRAMAFSFLSGLSGYSHTSSVFNGLVVRREALAPVGDAAALADAGVAALGVLDADQADARMAHCNRGAAIAAMPRPAPGAIGSAFAGGIYAGIIRGVDGGPDQHLVLVDGDVGDLSWEAASAWAQSIDGSLPTRAEQALLFANLKDQFQLRWYWSCEQAGPSAAWFQGFTSGYQSLNYRSYEGRARAVRRLPI